MYTHTQGRTRRYGLPWISKTSTEKSSSCNNFEILKHHAHLVIKRCSVALWAGANETHYWITLTGKGRLVFEQSRDDEQCQQAPRPSCVKLCESETETTELNP